MSARPLLLLDVDGPLNPYAAKPSRRPAGYVTHRMRPSGWDHPSQKPLRVWLNPDHGPLLLALPYDLMWATTWGAEANEWIAPHLGLPELPYVDFDHDSRPVRDRMPDGTYWKTHQILAQVNRPFVWVDDEIGVADRNAAEGHSAPALLHFVSPAKGLLDADFDALRLAAGSLTVPIGETE